MTRAMGLAVGLLLAAGTAGAGDVLLQVGVAHFNREYYEHHNPPIFIGASLLGEGIFVPFLRPELEIGYWRTNGRERIPVAMASDGSLDWMEQRRWRGDYQGADVGLRLAIDEGPQARNKNRKSWPSVGVGISHHWVGEIGYEDIGTPSHFRGSVFGRVNVKAGETREIFFEIEGSDQLDNETYWTYSAIDAIVKLGYRFRAF